MTTDSKIDYYLETRLKRGAIPIFEQWSRVYGLLDTSLEAVRKYKAQRLTWDKQENHTNTEYRIVQETKKVEIIE